MRAVKSVKQNYVPTPEILILLDEFRKMVNDCVRIGLAENVTSMKALSKKAYHQLARYNVPTCYRLTAISNGTGILRNYRKTLKTHPQCNKPYAKKLMLTDCYSFRIEQGKLRLQIRSMQYIYIPLNLHTLSVISGYTVRSVNLTARNMSLAFSKEIATIEPTGLIGLDRNLDNATTATLNGETKIYDLSDATRTKAIYREVKSHFKRNDARIQKRIFGKYGVKQCNRVNQRLHIVSKAIVEQAKKERLGIVMENLKGIRKLYRKGNGQGKEYRSRLNSWSFYELQRQIECKAKWCGIPVSYVQAAKTSSVCSTCGSSITECTERKVYCHKCNKIMDRDENAALNIVRQGLRFKLGGFAREVMRGDDESLILRAEANQLTRQGGVRHPTPS